MHRNTVIWVSCQVCGCLYDYEALYVCHDCGWHCCVSCVVGAGLVEVFADDGSFYWLCRECGARAGEVKP